MKYLFILVFIIVYLCFGTELGYTSVSPVYARLTFSFQHAGILHLVINSIAFIGIYRELEKEINRILLSFAIVILPALCSYIPCAAYDTPTVGASGMIYAMSGMFIMARANNRFQPIKGFALYLSCLTLSIIVSFFKPNSNFWLHLFCLAAGILFGCLRLYKVWLLMWLIKKIPH